jgi:pimeloyl-ACP methyl ester carboxylesterase
MRGTADPYVTADPVDGSRRYAPQGRFIEIPEAGHFAHEEAPKPVNDQLYRFLNQIYRPVMERRSR